jgi:hypothetical protein
MPSDNLFSGLVKRSVYITVAVIILLAGVFIGWSDVSLSPRAVFWDMIDNSLATTSFTTEVNQNLSQSSSVKQFVQVDLGLVQRARSLTILKQNGAEVESEIIGTRTANYTRYVKIIINQKGEQGKSPDVSKLINVWSKAVTSAQSSTVNLMGQAILGLGLPVGAVPVLVGNLSASQRTDLVGQIRNLGVYEPELGKGDVHKSYKNGNLLYTYNVKIRTILYVQLIKQFADDLGFHELDSINPNNYATATPLTIVLTVNAYSRQLVEVNSGQGYSETYEDYGLPFTVTLPQHTISATELQNLVNTL